MQQMATAAQGGQPPPNNVNMNMNNNGAPGVGVNQLGPQDPNAMAAAMSAMAAAAAQGQAAAGTGNNGAIAPGGGGGNNNLLRATFVQQQMQEHNAAAAAAHAAAAMAERNLSTAASRSIGGNGRNSWVQVDANGSLPGAAPGENTATFGATDANMMMAQQQQQQQQKLMEQLSQHQTNFSPAAAPGSMSGNPSQMLVNPYGQQFNPSLQQPIAPNNLAMPQQPFQQQQLTANMNPYAAATGGAPSDDSSAAFFAAQPYANPAAAGTLNLSGSYTPLAMLGLNIPAQPMAAAFGMQSLPGGPGYSKKKSQRKKNKFKPKRPLSAYNLFFKDERARILKSIPEDNKKKNDDDEDGDDAADEDSGIKKEDDGDGDEDNEDKEASKEDSNDNGNDGAQANKKQKVPHGKIGFENLAKLIGKRWQNLDPRRVEHYKALADKDMKRYKDEMEVFLTKQEMDLAKDKDVNASIGSIGDVAKKSNKRKDRDETTSMNNGMMTNPIPPMPPVVAPGGVGMGPGFELFGANNLRQMKDHWERQYEQQVLAGEITAKQVAEEKKRRAEKEQQKLLQLKNKEGINQGNQLDGMDTPVDALDPDELRKRSLATNM